MNNAPDPTDAELLERYRAGEVAAFDELVVRWQSPLLRFASSLLRERSAAEDVVQDVFMRLLQTMPDGGNAASLGAWLFKVCRNRCYDVMKMDTRETARRDSATGPQASPDPAVLVEHQELHTLVGQELNLLPEREREVLRLKVHDGLSYAEIAEVVGVAPGTVGWLIHQGLERLCGRLRAIQAS